MFRRLWKKTVAFTAVLMVALTMSCSVLVSADISQFTPVTDGSYLNFMSFNLRYDTTSNPLMSTEIRGSHLLQLVQSYLPDSVGFQEATDTWMGYLRNAMAAKNYAYVGVGRDTGTDDPTRNTTSNEFAPVFYRSDKYEALESGTFWLAPTLDVVSGPAWNAGNKRVCTYVVLKNKTTSEIYAHFNTHLDDQSEVAKINGIRIIQSRISGLEQKYSDGIGVVLTGDFNSVRFDASNPYYISTVYDTATSRMDDARAIADQVIVDGSTWSGYQNPTNWENGVISNNDKPAVDISSSPIDFLFLSKDMFDVKYYTVVDDTFTFDYNNTTYHDHPVSDHYGVYCSAKLNGTAYSTSSFDESKLITYPAAIYLGGDDSIPADVLSRIESYTNVAPASTPTSNLTCDSTRTIAKVVIPGSSGTQLAITKDSNAFWEITLALQKVTQIQAITYGTSGTVKNIPSNVEVFVSRDNYHWKQVGASIVNKAASNSNSYLVLNEPAEARYVKFSMADAYRQSTVKNIAVYGTEGIAADTVQPEEIQTISGPKSGQTEGYEKLFDCDVATKFYAKASDSTYNVPIIWKTAQPATIDRYCLTTANDNTKFPGRYPTAWTLYGSVTGSSETDNWTVIDDKTDQKLPNANYQECMFTVDHPDEYQYFKLVFNALGSANSLQISELTLYKQSMSGEANKETLQALCDANKDKSQGNYTDSSWKIFQTALQSALETLNSDQVTQDTVDNAINELNTAVAGLTENSEEVNKITLQTLYNTNKDKTQGNYTNSSWTIFQTALQNALGILNNDHAAQGTVDSAYKELQAAISGLSRKNNGNHSNSNSNTNPQTSSEQQTSAATFTSDTSSDFNVNGKYQFKITSTNGQAPQFTIGTDGIFKTRLVKQEGNNYYYEITAIGQSGAKAGIYINGVKILAATVGNTVPIVKSDTTVPFTVKAGASYMFKLTAESKPEFSAGTPSAFQVEFVKAGDKDYYYLVTAVGRPGESSGFYISTEKTCITVATISK